MSWIGKSEMAQAKEMNALCGEGRDELDERVNGKRQEGTDLSSDHPVGRARDDMRMRVCRVGLG